MKLRDFRAIVDALVFNLHYKFCTLRANQNETILKRCNALTN